MATSIKFVHYYTDKNGDLGAAGGQFSPGTVVATAPDAVARSLINAYFAVATAAAATANVNSFMQVFAGAGKTTVADADWAPLVPVDGHECVVRDTTTGNAKHAIRVGGVWKYVAVA